jgi:hypothetical protein
MRNLSGEALARGRLMLMPRLSTRVLLHFPWHRGFLLPHPQPHLSVVPHHDHGLRYRLLRHPTRLCIPFYTEESRFPLMADGSPMNASLDRCDAREAHAARHGFTLENHRLNPQIAQKSPACGSNDPDAAAAHVEAEAQRDPSSSRQTAKTSHLLPAANRNTKQQSFLATACLSIVQVTSFMLFS